MYYVELTTISLQHIATDTKKQIQVICIQQNKHQEHRQQKTTITQRANNINKIICYIKPYRKVVML